MVAEAEAQVSVAEQALQIQEMQKECKRIHHLL
jgi:uncharacterized membrane protein